MSSVELVASAQTILRYFPERHDELTRTTGPYSAKFPIDPSKCETALGHWLANHVPTTRFGMPGSVCLVWTISPDRSDARQGLMQLLDSPLWVRRDTFPRLLDEIELWVSEQRARINVATQGTPPTATQFRWPVFGAIASLKVQTPETYFDFCARTMAAKRLIVKEVNGSAPPLYLQRMFLARALES